MGRVTYQEMAGYWPTSTDDYAVPMNEIPKVVFSQTLQEATWPESSVARGNLADEIATLRRQPTFISRRVGAARWADGPAPTNSFRDGGPMRCTAKEG
jgi:dihydrofolate reductase